MWMAKVKFKTNYIAELVQKGVITEREREELEAARDFLLRVRNALHFLSGQHQDQLTFEYQERIAADLGFRETAHGKGVEHFMRTYYLHAATINRFADEIIERCVGAPHALSAHRPPQRRATSAPACASRHEVAVGDRRDVLRDDPSN